MQALAAVLWAQIFFIGLSDALTHYLIMMRALIINLGVADEEGR